MLLLVVPAIAFFSSSRRKPGSRFRTWTLDPGFRRDDGWTQAHGRLERGLSLRHRASSTHRRSFRAQRQDRIHRCPRPKQRSVRPPPNPALRSRLRRPPWRQAVRRAHRRAIAARKRVRLCVRPPCMQDPHRWCWCVRGARRRTILPVARKMRLLVVPAKAGIPLSNIDAGSRLSPGRRLDTSPQPSRTRPQPASPRFFDAPAIVSSTATGSHP